VGGGWPPPSPARSRPRSSAPAVAPQGTYTDWNWPATSGGYYNFDHDLRIQQVTPNAPYFWSHQFGFVDGDGGYLGLQSNGVGFDGYRGKLAIFSIWQATAASGPACGTFGGEGTGYSCKIPYEWVANRRYRLRLWATGTDGADEWWGAWVMDRTTGAEQHIGSIRVPLPWGWLGSWSVMWTSTSARRSRGARTSPTLAPSSTRRRRTPHRGRP
jgi:hypothetical protein